jgi:hypothetical protein
MPTYNGITMEAADTLTFWVRWAASHDKTYPLLARALPHWKEFFPEEAAPREDIWDPSDQQASNIHWEEDLSLSEPWVAQEAWEKAPEVLERVEETLNKAAFDRLLEITTSGPQTMAVWEELSYPRLLELAAETPNPLTRFALLEGAVELDTQITWFAAWWIGEWNPPAVPTPQWSNTLTNLLEWPSPVWEDAGQPPLPRWYREWLHEWMESNYGSDPADWQETTTF